MFFDEIHKIVLTIIDNIKLTEYAYGEILAIDPLSIKIDQKLIIPNEAIILTTSVGSLSSIEDIGDKVIMLRVDKGQKFIVLSKVV